MGREQKLWVCGPTIQNGLCELDLDGDKSRYKHRDIDTSQLKKSKKSVTIKKKTTILSKLGKIILLESLAKPLQCHAFTAMVDPRPIFPETVSQN